MWWLLILGYAFILDTVRGGSPSPPRVGRLTPGYRPYVRKPASAAASRNLIDVPRSEEFPEALASYPVSSTQSASSIMVCSSLDFSLFQLREVMCIIMHLCPQLMHKQRKEVESAENTLTRLGFIYNEMADIARATASSLNSALTAPNVPLLEEEIQNARMKHDKLEQLRKESTFTAESLRHSMTLM